MNHDLTRWNRAGLKKFRYINGNAATYLEELRQALLARFPAWTALDADIPAGETAAERNARLEAQYRELRREWGWEIARTFARAAHVLTEYLDAYANEGYLGTATQWENVRRLVEMIGYHPAPPASASTPLVLLAKSGASGIVARGFQVGYTPRSGPPVVFETLDDLEVDAGLNALHPAQWNWSPASLSTAIWQSAKEQKVSAGALALLVNPATDLRFVVKVSGVGAGGQLTLASTHVGDNWSAWHRGDSRLDINPSAVYKPRLNGTGVIRLPAGHGLAAGDRIAWLQDGMWRYDRIVAMDNQNVQLRGAVLPSASTPLYRVRTISADSTGILRFPLQYRNISTTASGAASPPASALITTYSSSGHGYTSSYGQIEASAGIGTLYMVPQEVAATTVAVGLPTGDFVFDGAPGDLASGELVIGETGAGQYQVLEVKEVIKREADFTIRFVTAPGSLIRLYGPMRDSLRPLHYNVNPTPLSNPLQLQVAAGATLSSLLATGRRVVIEQVDEAGATLKAWSAKLSSVDRAAGEVTLDKLPPATDGYTLGNAILRANVVMSGHGEAKPVKVLGSGDATTCFQSFVLGEKNVAFVADSTMAAGVAAAVEVKVGERIWKQVSRLDDSGPTDPHYTVRSTEEGDSLIEFGDGRHGRRLPTGAGNIKVAYRTGAGLAGNVAAGSLIKPVKPHAAIDKVRQPLAATGGNNREPIASLRGNAPAALFTLERAVSVEDYARLAERNSSVWQARAFRPANQGAQQERIRVVVVPAGGGTLGDLKKSLTDFLEAHDLAGTTVEVVNHVAVPFNLDITVRVNSGEYPPEEVKNRVIAALLEAFALKVRRLGGPLYPSEITAVVEAVEGALNSQCLITDSAFVSFTPPPRVLKSASGQVRLVFPQPEQVLILDAALSSITVRTMEFSL